MANNGQTADLLQNSVTANDLGTYQGNGVVNITIPWFMLNLANYPLPSELPPYWSLRFGVAAYWGRDLVLRTTMMHEAFWGGAVAKVATKSAAKSFDLVGPRSGRYHDMLLDWGADGYVPSQQRGIIDYLCTNNGEWIEIVRATNAAGSRILGLVHLDSLRTVRTGDPDTPALFYDLQGRYHSLRDYQVFNMVAMPDPASASLGIGHCAAERAYPQIYKQMVVEQYYKEKITGMGASKMHVLRGLTTEQVDGILKTARGEAVARGFTQFQGNIILGILSQADLEHIEIDFRDLPDGFDREKELQIAQLAYANAIGIDPQELDPQLVGRGALGIGAQSQILHEKQEGYGPAARDKQLTQFINEYILPDSVTFAFQEADLREEAQKANIALTREQTRNSMILNGEITAPQGLQMAVDSKDAPPEFLTVDQTEETALGDEEKPVEQAQLVQDGAQEQTALDAEAQPIAPSATKERGDLAALVAALNDTRAEIVKAREALAQ